MARAEAGVVILLPTKCRRVCRRPCCPGSPSLHVHSPIPLEKVDGGRTLGCLAGTPCLFAGNTQRRALADQPKRQPEIERPARLETRPDIGLQALPGQRQLKGERAARAGRGFHGEIAVVHAGDLS